MADRADMLDRIVLALSRPGVTGVLGTPDVIEDLLLLGALEGKSVFGSMNRGGLVRRRVGDRRPLHGLRRGHDRGDGLRGRQDAHADRPRGSGHGRDRRGLQPRRRRPGRPPAGGDGRAVHVAPRRRPGPQRPLDRSGDPRLRDRREPRPDLGLHVAEGPRGRGHGARGRGDDAADRAARRRGRPRPGRDVRALAAGRSRRPTCSASSSGRSLLYPPDDDVAAAVDAAAGLFPSGAAA